MTTYPRLYENVGVNLLFLDKSPNAAMGLLGEI